MDTIFALATAHGKAGVAVVRVSGPLVGRVCDHFGVSVRAGGRSLRRLRNQAGEILDEALLLHFNEGESFTGEEVLELHLHGSRAVVSSVMAELESIDGLRLADAGEFTRRAFENGQLDLTQVEALADLIDAETEAQRLQAQRVFSGELREKADSWREQLLQISALFTAGIDFADEEIPDDVADQAVALMETLIADVAKHQSDSINSERIRDGFEVAILGAPNAGKSTLLNRIAGREAAIVSDVAGTTRDVIEVQMDLRGLPVTFLDTAGLRETDDQIETIGVERAIERAKNADLRVFLLSDDPISDLDPMNEDIVIKGKNDISGGNGVSGLTGAGVDELLSGIGDILSRRVGGGGLAIRERHRHALRSAENDLREAKEIFSAEGDAVLASELVNAAIRAMDTMVGRVDVESVLGQIFSSFCVGK